MDIRSMDTLDSYRKAIQKEFGTQAEVFLFWKGRVALYSILRAIGVGEGDEVIVPGYTCVVVPNAVFYTGGMPVYVDVEKDTYTVTAERIRPLITPRTKAIIAQNTYGLSADLDSILALAKELDIEVIDDCTHGFGGRYKGALNGSKTKAAFFSTQWNKPYSTGIGGFAVINDIELSEKISAAQTELAQPGFKEVLSLRLMHFARKKLLTESTYWTLVKLYRWLSARNLVTGSSQGEELTSPKMPADFSKAHSTFQANVGLKEISKWKTDAAFRKSIAIKYNEVLISLGKQVPVQPEYADHLFLKYPILVSDRSLFMKLAETSKIRLGDWFISPLHPIVGDLSAWGYTFGSCPNAEFLADRVVNLPTDPDLSETELNGVIQLLKDRSDLIL